MGALPSPRGEPRCRCAPRWERSSPPPSPAARSPGSPPRYGSTSWRTFPASPAPLACSDHLVEGLAQGADAVRLVLRNLPGRDCHRAVSTGELGPDEIERYEADFVDPIAGTLARPSTRGCAWSSSSSRALPLLVAHTGGRAGATPECQEMATNGHHIRGIDHAVETLGAPPRVYVYLDLGSHKPVGFDDTFGPTARLARDAVTSSWAASRCAWAAAGSPGIASPTKSPSPSRCAMSWWASASTRASGCWSTPRATAGAAPNAPWALAR
ncbi:hypothetical protein DEH69_17030 [Streptomyces sp. PT12]|nr:hypothetical protein DEH69_17030 [Streptomyces sp. PT12]